MTYFSRYRQHKRFFFPKFSVDSKTNKIVYCLPCLFHIIFAVFTLKTNKQKPFSLLYELMCSTCFYMFWNMRYCIVYHIVYNATLFITIARADCLYEVVGSRRKCAESRVNRTIHSENQWIVHFHTCICLSILIIMLSLRKFAFRNLGVFTNELFSMFHRWWVTVFESFHFFATISNGSTQISWNTLVWVVKNRTFL